MDTALNAEAYSAPVSLELRDPRPDVSGRSGRQWNAHFAPPAPTTAWSRGDYRYRCRRLQRA